MNTDIEVLPPLPKPRPYGYIAKTEYLFTAAQMRDYARACIAADRAKRAAGEPVKLVPSVFGFPPSPPAQRVEKAAPAPADRTLFRQMLEHLYSLDADKPLRWHLRGGLAGEVTDIALAVIGRPASAPMEANADEQERALQELVDDAQEFGMGYGADPTGMTPVAADRLTEVECPPDPDIVDRALAADRAELAAECKRLADEAFHYMYTVRNATLTNQDRAAMHAAIDRLAAAPETGAGLVSIPDQIRAIIERLHTQDNRITDNPLFAVQQKRRVFGLDADYRHGHIWVDYDGEECDEDPSAREVGYVDQWEFVTGCFTEQGCNDYIRANGHNLNEPRIYAYGSYRNAEFIALRKWLMSLAAAPSTKEAGHV